MNKKYSHSCLRNSGFTLIEIALYVSLMAILLFGLTLLMTAISEGKERNLIIGEVEGQGISIMQKITQTLSKTKSIDSPEIGNSGTTLSLTTSDTSLNPTTFTLTNGALFFTEGNQTPIRLSNNKVIISDLTFSNLSRPDTAGSVRIQFVLENTPEFATIAHVSYKKVFQTTATLTTH